MVKNILVALDPDSDTPIATEYACKIGLLHEAHLTGIAVVDTHRIEKQSYAGGIGSMYYGEKLKQKWMEQTRTIAQGLITRFAQNSAVKDLPVDYMVKEGMPAERIADEMRYHDLLLLGNTPHFFYVHPEEKTNTLIQIVKHCVAPVLVVPDHEVNYKTVLIAYDGSGPASRAMQRFCQLQPFGLKPKVHVVTVYDQGAQDRAELMLTEARKYVSSWGFDVQTMAMKGDRDYDHIKQYADRVEAGTIVAGAHSVSKVSEMVFGSTMASLLDSNDHILSWGTNVNAILWSR